ncbi:sugar phosphate isomerase/epimerase family protein [Rhodohalobacter sp. 8-1]|uniref:sugar phosphate isomerase/epimerase family protein n=1 Tax=Rhodohalobacter sp. 8-1 TaxID=3131972 RepID=UPI0030EF25F9
MNRKTFLSRMGYSALGGAALFSAPLGFTGCASSQSNELFFDISLAQWSLHRTFFGDALEQGWEFFGNALQNNPEDVLRGDADPLNFAKMARQQFDIGAVEYVNTFYFDKAENESYLNELKNVADNEGVESVLIMVDAEGNLGDPDESARQQAVENHYKWVHMAKFLGCHTIRVNAASSGSYEEQMQRSADGLRNLSEYAAGEEINVVVENHGGLSSNGEWLANTIEMVDMSNCGTLPDFGNFTIGNGETYDNYKGVEELMPYAKGVSAKTHAFDDSGRESNLDYTRLLQIVKDAGYTGHVGIEYEGSGLSETEGIIATKELLLKVGRELT